MLQAFTDELSFGLARVLGSNLASGIHSQLEMTARHEIVVRILWRGPDEGLYTLGLHMHNSHQSFVLQRAGPSPPAFLCPQFGLIRACSGLALERRYRPPRVSRFGSAGQLSINQLGC